MRRNRQDRLWAIFLIFGALINFPVITIFRSADTLGGVPLLFVYVFVLWALFIVALALVANGSNWGGGKHER